MLLQTNSYIVPAEKRLEHQRLVKRFRQVMAKLGCDMFDVYEQVGSNWSGGESTGRYVQIMRFRDNQHQRQVQAAERSDPTAQALIAEFCELINLPYQQQQGLFAVGFYRGVPGATSPGAAAQHQPVQQEDEVVEQPLDQQQYEEAPAPIDEGAAGEVAYEVHGQEAEPLEAAAEPQEESPQEFVVEGETTNSGNHEHEPPTEPNPLDEFDIESLAEEEITGFHEAHDENEQPHRKRP